MYLLLVLLHGIFLFLSFLLGNWGLLIAFALSAGFFIFYFSPFFTSIVGNETSSRDDMGMLSSFLTSYSVRPLFVPVVLFYSSIYLFLYTVFRGQDLFVWYHCGVIIFVFLGLLMTYGWTHHFSTFLFQLLRYHLIFVFLTSFIYFLFILFVGGVTTFFLGVLLMLSLLLWGGLFRYARVYLYQSDFVFYLFGLLGIYTTLGMGIYQMGYTSLFSQTFLIVLLSLGIFFVFSLIEDFSEFHVFSRYIGIFGLYFSMILSYSLLTLELWKSFFLLFLIGAAFLQIHIRYENYVSYLFFLGNLLLMYIIVFSPLLSAGILLAFSFSFLFSLFLIGVSYLIRQSHMRDFFILHTMALGFSLFTSFYYFFRFASSGSGLGIDISLFLFGMTILAFLSYFRFHIKKEGLIPEKI